MKTTHVWLQTLFCTTKRYVSCAYVNEWSNTILPVLRWNWTYALTFLTFAFFSVLFFHCEEMKEGQCGQCNLEELADLFHQMGDKNVQHFPSADNYCLTKVQWNLEVKHNCPRVPPKDSWRGTPNWLLRGILRWLCHTWHEHYRMKNCLNDSPNIENNNCDPSRTNAWPRGAYNGQSMSIPCYQNRTWEPNKNIYTADFPLFHIPGVCTKWHDKSMFAILNALNSLKGHTCWPAQTGTWCFRWW